MVFPRPRRTTLVAAAAVVAITVPAAGLTTAYTYAGDIPRGTTVLGIDLGAMSQDEAAAALRSGLARRVEQLAAPLEIRIAEAETQVQPADVGLGVDVDATVAAAAAGSRNPFAALFGTREVAPVVEIDADRLDEALRDTAKEVGEAMTMPEIRFEDTTAVPVYPEPGLGLDPEVSAEAVTDGWLRRLAIDGGSPGGEPPDGEPPREEARGGEPRGGETPREEVPREEAPRDGWLHPEVIAVPLVEVNPVTTAEDVDRLLADLAEPAVAEPVAIATPDGATVTASPAAIAASLDLSADSRGEITPKVDPEALREALADQLAEVETEPVDARVAIDGDEPKIVPSSPGELLDTDALARELLAVLPEPAPRSVDATMTEIEAEVGSSELAELGIEEQVSTFTTYFDGGLDAPRSQNIVRVAEMVDGAVVQPGEVFSLNGYTGERGYDEGFVDAPVIIDGKLVPGVGGGISQFTTTLFNAAYYAGLEDVEHHPHSYHFSRYPPVIESTIFYPTLDLRFRNDTPYGVLIDTSYTASSITVSMWSTMVYDEVTTEWSERRDIVKPQTRYLPPGPSCIATEGIEGFTQDAWRILVKDGKEDREKFTWRYEAEPRFICDEEPDDDD